MSNPQHSYKSRLLSLLALLCWGGMFAASPQPDDDFDPTNPPEPAVITYCKLTVSADPSEGAYVSGSGKYMVGSGSVYVSTSACNSSDYTYEFQYWTLDSEKYSTEPCFYYTPTAGTHTLVAHYEKTEVVWDPASPDEPTSSTINHKYYLYLTTNFKGCCSFNIASGNKQVAGSEIYLCAYPSNYYQFEAWKVNGETVSTSQEFYYTMPDSAVTIEAVLSEIPYDPDSPMEPSGSGTAADNPTPMPGDANGDAKLTIADVTAAVSYLKGKVPAGFNATNADADGNGSINDEDVKEIVKLLCK